ncbi:hypothetical protein TALC_01389 [Thermoplasmatales archaeon BRNA1]|nr:hypothetical protein TALC_01389 [Thermoplasmatales archaeon BRNA1]
MRSREERKAAREKEKERKKGLDSFDRGKEKEYKKYLNSKSRFVKGIVYSVIEYILVIVFVLAIVAYTQGDDMSHFQDDVIEMLKPGNFIFTALVSFLPIIILGNISTYFGIGTVPKMAIGIIRCLILVVWIYVVLIAAGNIDLMEVTGLSRGNTGLDGLTIGMDGLARFAAFILMVSILIPIGEFAGARKKHKEALAWYNATYKNEDSDEKETAED